MSKRTAVMLSLLTLACLTGYFVGGWAGVILAYVCYCLGGIAEYCLPTPETKRKSNERMATD